MRSEKSSMRTGRSFVRSAEVIDDIQDVIDEIRKVIDDIRDHRWAHGRLGRTSRMALITTVKQRSWIDRAGFASPLRRPRRQRDVVK
jgi:hypothetical protein